VSGTLTATEIVLTTAGYRVIDIYKQSLLFRIVAVIKVKASIYFVSSVKASHLTFINVFQIMSARKYFLNADYVLNSAKFLR
jgi:glutamate formiminotransferase